MKKIKSLSLVLGAAILLSACAGTGNISSTSITSGSTSAAGIVHPLENEEPAVTEVTEPPEPVDTRTPWEKVSEITEACGDNVRIFESVPFQNTNYSQIVDGILTAVSFSNTDEEFSIKRFDLNSGTITEKKFGIYNGYITAYSASGYSVIFKDTDAEIEVYDSELNITDKKSFGEFEYGVLTQVSDSSFIISSYGSNIISLIEISADGKITASKSEINIRDNVNLLYINSVVGGGKLLLNCYANDDYTYLNFLYDISDGTAAQLSIRENGSVCAVGDKIIVTDIDSHESDIYSPETPNLKRTLSFEQDAMPIYTNYNHKNIYCCKSDDENVTLYAYSPETGECLGKVTLNGKYYSTIYQVSEYEDYLFIAGFLEGDYPSAYVCRLGEAEKAEGYAMLEAPDYGFLIKEAAKEISSRYGVDVYYGNDAVKYFGGYVVVSETDEKKIYNAVMNFSSFLAKFPEGFIQEMCENSCGRMNVYFTGRILPDNSGESISDAAAFAYTDNDIQTVVADITQYGLEETFAHEFMHIIENTIYAKAYENPDRIYESFIRLNMLNPSDFSYYYDYTDENGVTLGYSSSAYSGSSFYENGNADDVYFVDGYSMTYPSEDMARIFQNLFMNSKEDLPPFFSGINMKLKSAYICAVIRDAFDCITPETVVSWENSIESEYTLDYFRENYDYMSYLDNIEAVG